MIADAHGDEYEALQSLEEALQSLEEAKATDAPG